MFDEEGRKIDLGLQIGMNLDGMSIEELTRYIQSMHDEIKRTEKEIENRQHSAAAAEALFK